MYFLKMSKFNCLGFIDVFEYLFEMFVNDWQYVEDIVENVVVYFEVKVYLIEGMFGE